MNRGARVTKYISGGILLGLVLVGLTAQSKATDYDSTNFTIRDPVISVGGGRATSTSFQVYSSLGQTAIGQSTSTDFIIRSGFLYYPGPDDDGGGPAGGGPAVQLTITTGRLIDEISEGVTFSGRAYPNAKITLLKDGQLATTTIAASDSSFSISLGGLSAGDYILGVYAQDNKGNRSLFQAYPITVILGQNVNVSGVFIAPTLSLDKSEVRKGDSITIYGQSAPGAIITVVINSDHESLAETRANNIGNYSYGFNTASLPLGRHLAKTQASFQGAISPFSKLVTFIVGTKNVVAPRIDELAGRSDVNGDGRVNLVDLSIAIYWYNRSASTEIKFPEFLDLNNDKKIDLIDFSIMAFYWTG